MLQIAENQNRKISKFGSILLSPTVVCIYGLGKVTYIIIIIISKKKKIKCINFVCISWSCCNLTLLRSTSTKVPYARNCRQVKRSPMILIMWSWVFATQYRSAWTKNVHFRRLFSKKLVSFSCCRRWHNEKKDKRNKTHTDFLFSIHEEPHPALSRPKHPA